jgi:serine/threonine protein kinase
MDDRQRKQERNKLVRSVFEGALAEPPDGRTTYVRTHSNGDAEVELEVIRLLNSAERVGQIDYLNVPALKREAPEANLQTGMQFGPYRVISKLGSGGMGSVYLVERSDDSFRKTAALKVIRPDCVAGDLLRRFHQERQILADLDHPNIARILDGGTTTDGLPYFVMEYVAGTHIDKYCSDRVSLKERIRLFIQVCTAVDYLHKNGVIHRDLKPSNILVTAKGTVKLVDFGIAKVIGASPDSPQTVPLVTPGYSSPEQLLGKPIGTAGDVYSLGVILCELLTGSKPFTVVPSAMAQHLVLAATTAETVVPSSLAGKNKDHLSAETPAHLRRLLKGDLDNILVMAMRIDPTRRYATAGGLASDLQNYLDARPVVARRDSLIYRTGKLVRRNWHIASIGVICLGLLGWGINERIQREILQQKVGKLESAAEESVSRLQEHLAAIQAQASVGGSQQFPSTSAGPRPSVNPKMYAQEIDDLAALGKVFKDSLSEAIRLRPGMTTERRQLVDMVADYLSAASIFATDDPKLRKAIAEAYLWLGDIRGYPDNPNLGDESGALEMYVQARNLLAPQAADPSVGQLLASVESHANAVRLQSANANR